jgi:hypothetical protein
MIPKGLPKTHSSFLASNEDDEAVLSDEIIEGYC